MLKTFLIVAGIVIVVGAGWYFFRPEVAVAPGPVRVSGYTYDRTSSDVIVVEHPYPGSAVGKEFSVKGKARGYWFFEASFPVEVTDPSGIRVAQAVAQASSDWMTEDFVPFKATLKVPESYLGPATVVLHKDNPSGLPEHDASVSFSVTVKY